jgi:hypothetical protein
MKLSLWAQFWLIVLVAWVVPIAVAGLVIRWWMA